VTDAVKSHIANRPAGDDWTMVVLDVT
jgi:hypothetical protein